MHVLLYSHVRSAQVAWAAAAAPNRVSIVITALWPAFSTNAPRVLENARDLAAAITTSRCSVALQLASMQLSTDNLDCQHAGHHQYDITLTTTVCVRFTRKCPIYLGDTQSISNLPTRQFPNESASSQMNTQQTPPAGMPWHKLTQVESPQTRALTTRKSRK